jgi:excisionase family DNA binding protein
MIERTGHGPVDGEQLALPFTASATMTVALEPISVRIADAIRLTGIRRSKLYELIASGDLKTVKIGRCTLVPVASLHAMIERARQERL